MTRTRCVDDELEAQAVGPRDLRFEAHLRAIALLLLPAAIVPLLWAVIVVGSGLHDHGALSLVLTLPLAAGGAMLAAPPIVLAWSLWGYRSWGRLGALAAILLYFLGLVGGKSIVLQIAIGLGAQALPGLFASLPVLMVGKLVVYALAGAALIHGRAAAITSPDYRRTLDASPGAWVPLWSSPFLYGPAAIVAVALLVTHTSPVTPSAAPAPMTATIEQRYNATLMDGYEATPLRDVIADLSRRSGLVIQLDPPLVEHLRAHDCPVNESGGSSVYRILSHHLVSQLHVEVVIDEGAGGLLLRTPPASPTRWALRELVGPVDWRGLGLDDVVRDIERLTGLRVEVDAAVRPLLANARFRLVRGRDRADVLVETLSWGRPIRIEPRADRVVALVSARLPSDVIDARLDATEAPYPQGKTVQAVANIVFNLTDVFVACDPAIARVAVERQPGFFNTARQLLDALAAQGRVAWRIDDGIIVLGPAVPPGGTVR